MMKLYIALPLWAVAAFTFGHGGGVDEQGGHTDKSTGKYHCHREGCSILQSATQQQQTAIKYQREDWPHWSDVDGDCMNTRHEMLFEQADGPVNLSPDGCYVSTGVWFDPFSGQQYTRASDLDVDHIVPLKWAHDHGGAYWNRSQKETFANDPINLLVVDDGLNQSKGAQGPTEWLPPNHAYRCSYLEAWHRVLRQYPDLQMTSAEARVFNRMRAQC